MRSSRSFFTLAMAAKMHFEWDIQTQATDQPVLAHIQQLVEDEGRLFEQGQRGTVGEMDRQRLAQVQLELDQCWDLSVEIHAAHEYLPQEFTPLAYLSQSPIEVWRRSFGTCR